MSERERGRAEYNNLYREGTYIFTTNCNIEIILDLSVEIILLSIYYYSNKLRF
jgi:hypothetical protein